LIPEINPKIEMIESCKESWLLFFEENIKKFYERYENQEVYVDYKKYCEINGYMPFSNRMFTLRMKSVINIFKSSKNKKTFRYYLIKDEIKKRYEEGKDDDLIKLDDLE
jgi:hypothetical protein